MTPARRLLDDARVRQVLGLLAVDGDEARVVGGAVRNALLGRATQDIDVATTATPERVVARAKAAGLRTVPTGIAHGTVTVLVESRPFEVTTLREDIETDGRHAKIRFGRDFDRDALRRDFTINALSMGLDGEVHDYADGLADLAAGRVRFIGDPRTRIREDYLRILRFFRFSADYAAGPFDADGVSGAIEARAGLARLSRERIRQELLRLLAARRAVDAVEALAETGIATLLLGGVAMPARLARLVAITPPSDEAEVLLRLAATCVIVREDAERLRDRLRLSNAEATRLSGTAIAREHLTGAPTAPARLRERLFADGRTAAQDGLRLAWAESGAPPDAGAWLSAAAFLRDTPEPHLPFSGADLIARGVTAGKPLGDALKRLQANWIRAGLPNEPRALARLLDEVTRD